MGKVSYQLKPIARGFHSDIHLSARARELLRTIKETNADIVCLQEGESNGHLVINDQRCLYNLPSHRAFHPDLHSRRIHSKQLHGLRYRWIHCRFLWSGYVNEDALLCSY